MKESGGCFSAESKWHIMEQFFGHDVWQRDVSEALLFMPRLATSFVMFLFHWAPASQTIPAPQQISPIAMSICRPSCNECSKRQSKNVSQTLQRGGKDITCAVGLWCNHMSTLTCRQNAPRRMRVISRLPSHFYD